MSIRTTGLPAETGGFRQPLVRSKIWGFEPFWKFVTYDVELSSNSSSTSSGGKANIDDDFFFGGDLEKVDNVYNVSRKLGDGKSSTRIIPIQRVRTTSVTVSPPSKVTITERTDKVPSNVSSLNRTNRRSSTLERGKQTPLSRQTSAPLSRQMSAPLSRPYSTSQPVKIPSQPTTMGPRFDSLPTRFDEKKFEQPEMKLTSVLKKPGNGRSDRRSMKKVAFLENSY